MHQQRRQHNNPSRESSNSVTNGIEPPSRENRDPKAETSSLSRESGAATLKKNAKNSVKSGMRGSSDGRRRRGGGSVVLPRRSSANTAISQLTFSIDAIPFRVTKSRRNKVRSRDDVKPGGGGGAGEKGGGERGGKK